MPSQDNAPFIAAVGGANIDIHGRSTAPLRADDSNPGTVHVSAGGVARNVAENLARLGVDCRLVSAVGDDDHGRTLLQLSREAGIDVQHVQEFASQPTSTYLSVIDASGDMNVAINDMSVIDRLTPEHLQPHEAMLQQAALVVVDTNLSAEALAWLADSIKETPLFVDTVSAAKASRIKPILGSVHTLKTSTIEAEALTGLEADTEPQLQKVAAKLHAAGVGRIFVTRGSQGVFYSARDEQGVMKPEEQDPDVRNTGGAGDAFLAGVVYGWLDDRNLDETLRFALAAANLTVSDMSTSSPALSLDAINKVLEAHDAR